MPITGAEIGANDLRVGNDFPRTALGDFLTVVEHDDVPGYGHDRAHHMFDDDNGQAAF